MNTTTTLTAIDRCDRCGAQAYVRVSVGNGELLFCAHHAREHRDAFAARGATVTVDETERLLGISALDEARKIVDNAETT